MISPAPTDPVRSGRNGRGPDAAPERGARRRVGALLAGAAVVASAALGATAPVATAAPAQASTSSTTVPASSSTTSSTTASSTTSVPATTTSQPGAGGATSTTTADGTTSTTSSSASTTSTTAVVTVTTSPATVDDACAVPVLSLGVDGDRLAVGATGLGRHQMREVRIEDPSRNAATSTSTSTTSTAPSGSDQDGDGRDEEAAPTAEGSSGAAAPHQLWVARSVSALGVPPRVVVVPTAPSGMREVVELAEALPERVRVVLVLLDGAGRSIEVADVARLDALRADGAAAEVRFGCGTDASEQLVSIAKSFGVGAVLFYVVVVGGLVVVAGALALVARRRGDRNGALVVVDPFDR